MSNTDDLSLFGYVVKPQQPVTIGNMPRPLRNGEVYCHKCQQFFWLRDYDKHKQQCDRRLK